MSGNFDILHYNLLQKLISMLDSAADLVVYVFVAYML